MWRSSALFILKYRWILLSVLLAITAFMTYHASKVQLSYEFSRAIPTDNPKYLQYQEFRSRFGEDGNLFVIGIVSDSLFKAPVFNDYARLARELRNLNAVEDVLSIPGAANLSKDPFAEKLVASPVFPNTPLDQPTLDSSAALFFSLPFYNGFLYNRESNSYLLGVRINREVLNSKARDVVVDEVIRLSGEFADKHEIDMHYSGLPYIRTTMATRIAQEMQWFLLGSILLSAVILLIFFRSLSATALSLAVVIIGVLWSLGTMHLFGYRITILNALIPPLVVVIGIPNCIYFLNKYHTAYRETRDKRVALVEMISKMGIVTLFCNIAAAIGFAVFALTRSAILKEFGVVAGINIMALFFISIILIPAALSMLPSPKRRHMRYLDNRWLLQLLKSIEIWSMHHRKTIYTVTVAVIIFAIAGMFRLVSDGYIVDDLPKTDRVYTDLKFFERNFKGVMPLEIVIDTRRKNGLRVNPLQTFSNIDSLSLFIREHPDMARPISMVEGMKFARQAYYDGDSLSYGLPNAFDISFLSQYLAGRGSEDSTSNFARLLRSFMDTTRQYARISVNMADVGSVHLQEILDTLRGRSLQLFDTARYDVQFTGTSVTFLEGSSYIINGLKESIFWAFLLISLCMLYLFRSFRILMCSLIPNLIPLIITAGVMGWAGVRIKPSTVLVFSVALGIAIDITIRFLVNYKQELKDSAANPELHVLSTIHKTGISIIYTSMVLIAGFVIFCFSGFGGTQALGWLTSLTLVLATLTNLIFLPAILLTTMKKKE